MRDLGDETGHALVEALMVGLILLVPMIWLLTVSAELHAAALGTTAAAREAGFEAARQVDPSDVDAAVAAAVGGSLADHGLDSSASSVSIRSGIGWKRGSRVEVTVSYAVPVFQAPLLGAISDPAIGVSARHVTTIDPYRSRER